MALTSDKGNQMLASCFLDPPIECQGKGSVTFMPAFQPAQEFWGGDRPVQKIRSIRACEPCGRSEFVFFVLWKTANFQSWDLSSIFLLNQLDNSYRLLIAPCLQMKSHHISQIITGDITHILPGRAYFCQGDYEIKSWPQCHILTARKHSKGGGALL